jgi:spermidine synthase
MAEIRKRPHKNMRQESQVKESPLKGKRWFIDRDDENRLICHRVKKRILYRKTSFQHIEFLDTNDFGLIVVLDNTIQSAEKDEFIYHEALVHPAMILHPRPRKVLILGGGEGATLREVIRHPTVNQVIMVDIDEEFVNICKKHMKTWHRNAFHDPRVTLRFEDAIQYIRSTHDVFDVIIADISDPKKEGPAKLIYTKKFYSMARKILAADGIFVTHATEIGYLRSKGISRMILRTFGQVFPKSMIYCEYIPSFSCVWGFTIGSLRYSFSGVSAKTIEKRLRDRKLHDLSYYDIETHRRLFNQPKNVRKFMNVK